MKNLFYSKNPNTLFWIVGYFDMLNVSRIIEFMSNTSEKFAKIAQCETDEILTYKIGKSNKYNYMRVFYVETTYIPKEAYVLDELSMKEYCSL